MTYLTTFLVAISLMTPAYAGSGFIKIAVGDDVAEYGQVTNIELLKIQTSLDTKDAN